MKNYFDILFVRVYNQYKVWKEKDIPGVYALMVLSLFQALNVLLIITLINGSQRGRDWNLSKGQLILISSSILIINAIRIYKIIGIEKILEKYKQNVHLPIHPILYFILSIAALIITRLLGIFPRIVE